MPSETSVPGLAGTSLLGFLAAIGLLATAGEDLPQLRLSWTLGEQPHAIIASAAEDLSVHELVHLLSRGLARPGFRLGWPEGEDGLESAPAKVHVHRYRSLAGRSREGDAWVAALASDMSLDEDQFVRRSTLFNLSGQERLGHVVKELDKRVPNGKEGAELLSNALLGPWRYVAGVNSLGFDTTGTREAAYDGMNAPTRGVPGAVALALRAMPALPVFGAQTTGVYRLDGRSRFVWPLWSRPLGLNAARVLLGLQELRAVSSQRSPAAEESLRRWGVTMVLVSERTQRGGKGAYWQFNPATVAMRVVS
jgi:hypothetical protein